MLSGRGLCDELVTRPEESVVVTRNIVNGEALGHWGGGCCTNTNKT